MKNAENDVENIYIYIFHKETHSRTNVFIKNMAMTKCNYKRYTLQLKNMKIPPIVVVIFRWLLGRYVCGFRL